MARSYSRQKKEDINSAFHAFFQKYRDIKDIVLCLDNCMGQNKNWSLFTYLVYIVNSTEVETETITFKYLEPGHTFMSADSFHHQVEKSLNKMGKVYDFNDFSSAVSNANSGFVDIKIMEVGDFRNWPDHCSTYKISKMNPRPYLSKMSVVKVVRGKQTISYQTGFSEPEIELDFLSAKAKKNGIALPIARISPRGIPQEKKEDILAKLGSLMPASRKLFWEAIPVSTIGDLVTADDD